MPGGVTPPFPEGVTALKLSEVNRNAIIAGGTTVNDRVRKLLLILTATMVLILAALVLLFLNINAQYDSILKNADIAAGFNTEFKNSIDSAMYDHVITPRDDDSVSRLPTRELDEAVEVLRRMEKTTVLKDNVWRVHSMLNMCENLRRYMTEIALEPSYDTRMELLDRNIRGETGLTLLIENYMHDYIDDEVREMARLQDAINRRTRVVLACVVAGIALLVAIVLASSVRVTRNITTPLEALSRKAEDFGRGQFHSEPVKTDIRELATLDRGFDTMAERINALMAKQMEDQKYLHRAELELLQAQINPHFLYNTLDSIAILAENHREDDVVDMVTNLSSFFRNSLSKGRDLITLETEKKQVTSYLEIQSVRYSDKLRYEIDIPDELLNVVVPKLILQPLVENALYHGIKNRRGMGTISISACRDGEDLLLRVSDSGAGMTHEQLETLRAGIYEEKHTGLGLLNVHKRIRLYCGEPYGLSFESEQGVGTTVTVRLASNLTTGEETEQSKEDGKA